MIEDETFRCVRTASAFTEIQRSIQYAGIIYMFTVFTEYYSVAVIGAVFSIRVFSMPLYVGAVFSVQYLVCCTQFANLSIQYAGVMSL